MLALELRDLPRSRVVVLDEVQRAPALLKEVHRAIEGVRRRFVLLGSSARRLKTSAEPSYFANCSMKSKKSTGVSDPVLSIWPLIPAEVICPNLLR